MEEFDSISCIIEFELTYSMLSLLLSISNSFIKFCIFSLRRSTIGRLPICAGWDWISACCSNGSSLIRDILRLIHRWRIDGCRGRVMVVHSLWCINWRSDLIKLHWLILRWRELTLAVIRWCRWLYCDIVRKSRIINRRSRLGFLKTHVI